MGVGGRMPGTDIVGGDFTKTSRGDPRRDEVGEIELCRGEAQPPKRAHIQDKYIQAVQYRVPNDDEAPQHYGVLFRKGAKQGDFRGSL